ncbi:YtcA family lipoprotein [Paraburkholderia sp. CNPSo 3272]|uniref:YtcA family lipoprotein n=1 Tax=Paraburkholderia sp. CNPSo 3272 TaxID=2940931 RepID=UPI0020B8425B|nr:YtcA family lipoprotein [Paraburkholderia sp. CNPSo 3272]MCP3725137.1 YtcA family lipoprotein [Paraburkholderia sp. CNPSo 3272]
MRVRTPAARRNAGKLARRLALQRVCIACDACDRFMTFSTATRLAWPACASLSLGGCAISPSLPLFGAAFPDWLFCIAGGVVATVIVHRVLGRRGLRGALSPLAVTYPALTAIFATAAWLIFFAH